MELNKKISIFLIVFIFIALIRCLFEPFRLHSQNIEMNFLTIKPFLIGAIISSISVFISGLFYMNQKYLLSIFISILCIVLMILVKIIQ